MRRVEKEDRDRGVRGSVTSGNVGGQCPRTRHFGATESVEMWPAEAVSDVVKTSGPPVLHRAEPETLRGVPAAQVASGAGNARGAGTHHSIGWQTSVGRIARLRCRAIARSLGRTRALAWRKFAAPPDAEREWVEGETVRLSCDRPKQAAYGIVHGGNVVTKKTRRSRLASSRHEVRRSRAHARRSFTGPTKQGPSALRSMFTPSRFARSVALNERALGRGSESDSGVPGSDNGTSEVDTVR